MFEEIVVMVTILQMGQNGLQMGQNRKNCVSDGTKWFTDGQNTKNCVSDGTKWFADGTKQKNGLSDGKKWLTDGTKLIHVPSVIHLSHLKDHFSRIVPSVKYVSHL